MRNVKVQTFEVCNVESLGIQKYSIITHTLFLLSLTPCSSFTIFLSCTPRNDSIQFLLTKQSGIVFQKVNNCLSHCVTHFWAELFSLPLQMSTIYISYKANVLILDGADSRCRWGQFSCHQWPFRVQRLSTVVIADSYRLIRSLERMRHVQELT